ncbi:MAG TPA: DUF503 domain-containing protein [Solirubrobacteraceae bacterium]|nr:DUF503 domain-containing protein [Solirubrobacteraceae bacterium]
MAPRAFVNVLTIELHFPDCASLKAKRRELQPVKAHLQGRVGAAIAEVGHQDQWQRATLVAALAGGSAGRLEDVADGVQRWLDARFPHGARVERRLASLEDLGA